MLASAKRRGAGVWTTGSIDCLEEAVQLLRRAPLGVWGWWCLGTVPFLLGLLSFWAEMSRSALAAGRLGESALGLAALYIWMKCWQAVFARDLAACVAREPDDPWTTARVMRLIGLQGFIHPTGLFILPLAALITLPFGWAYAWYQNVSALGDGRHDFASTMRRAAHQAGTWSGQNHVLLLILFLARTFVFVNLAAVMALAPGLIRTLTGIDLVLASGTRLVFNTTFVAVAASLTWFCFDPLVKAAYVLRCFYGESLQTGADLRLELRRSAAAVTVMLLIVICLAPAGPLPQARAADTTGISVQRLDRAIAEEIGKPQYAWRMPRDRSHDTPVLPGFLTTWYKRITKTLGTWFQSFLDWLDTIWPKPEVKPRKIPSLLDTADWLQLLLLALLSAITATLVIRLRRRWLRRRETLSGSAAPVPPSVPDLNAEDVSPDLLPADGWRLLAQTFMARGESRLAVRALYLALLSHLAKAGLISLARHTSNREYLAAVERRATAASQIAPAFSRLVDGFERVWYGTHPADEALVSAFTADMELIVSHAG